MLVTGDEYFCPVIVDEMEEKKTTETFFFNNTVKTYLHDFISSCERIDKGI